MRFLFFQSVLFLKLGKLCRRPFIISVRPRGVLLWDRREAPPPFCAQAAGGGGSTEEKVQRATGTQALHGGRRQRVLGPTEPAARLLGVGLGAGGGSRSAAVPRRSRSLARFSPRPRQPGHPQRTLHGVLPPQRLDGAPKEERRFGPVRLRHGEPDLVPDVLVPLREPEHRPDSDPPV